MPRLAGLALAAACLGPTSWAADGALLIGVGDYPLLGKRLAGPANDLRLMRALLGRSGFLPQQIVELSERPERQGLPTRANIVQSLGDLAAQARRGDWIVVYFSGHGAQVPQSPATRLAYREPDGFDEVFLPRDTRRWNPASREVDGAIVDDEIGQAMTAMLQRGAKVWAIFDTCHASDMTRGPNAARAQPVERAISATELGVPARLYLQAQAAPRPARRAAKLPAVAPAATAMAVVFAAAQKGEATTEELFDDPLQPGAKAHFGIFTYALHQRLGQAPASFANAAAAIEAAYADRPFPKPRWSGALDQPLPLLAGRRAVQPLALSAR